jgi:hypothetical protein
MLIEILSIILFKCQIDTNPETYKTILTCENFEYMVFQSLKCENIVISMSWLKFLVMLLPMMTTILSIS